MRLKKFKLLEKIKINPTFHLCISYGHFPAILKGNDQAVVKHTSNCFKVLKFIIPMGLKDFLVLFYLFFVTSISLFYNLYH